MIALGVTVTASALAVGTGVALDRFVLPELRSEPTAAAAPSSTPVAPTPTGMQRTTKPPKRPRTSKPAPVETSKPPPTRTRRAPVRPTRQPSETAKPTPSETSPLRLAGGGAVATVASLTNAERAKAGCKPLRVDARLARAARRHSADMAARNYFDHTSRNGDSPWKRMEDAGYPSPGAENIAKGYATAAAVVAGWMKSPGHRANILNCDLRAIGVGMAAGRGGPLWTQDFGWT
ncbi:CAP domain-containing protein [Actinomadura litoris]|uniref:CAP domain-containing protein n=1 Tax=Actinomadura litoris TaxID=2678616 RepID=UPI001FA7B8B2|nr:CAP domain-containing protein [Actinomadura litoris]